MAFIDKLLGNTSEQRIKKLRPMLNKINGFEPSMQALTDEQLRDKTVEFRQRIENGETLDDLICEAYAVVREAAVRTIGQRHYDVQMLGGIVLHQGKIAEMKTGEGKTLTESLPAYLNALTGKGVHIVTVNDYLAQRDALWMGKIYNFLGMSVGCIIHDVEDDDRRKQYNCDITYGTNNEYGFDYLRDNMVVYKERMVQRELNFSIVDEVDSILIDEARTPLIISGRGDKSTDMYQRVDKFVTRLERGENIEKRSRTELMMGEDQPESGDYMVDIKARAVALTQQGIGKVESYFGVEDISSPDATELNHHIQQALKAHALFIKDKEYVVNNGEVLIVDEFTGRLMIGRRYSDGLHQAIESKEGVEIQNENKTLATITFQNYFRMYKKLSGMTGTAKTEESEFQGIYNLDVVEIPTNKPLIRIDNNDVVYATEVGKFNAVVEEIIEVHKTGQPILVGTVSVEKSEYLSDLLNKRGVRHQVLNAKQHAREAEIVAQAGKFGNVTIATNMAGRGTDILLGGNPEFLAKREMLQNGYDELMTERATGHDITNEADVLEARAAYNKLYEKHKKLTDAEHEKVVEVGGLHIIGTERHESRRIDNQLRGRSGRQGDPGSSRFFVSLEDDLMKRFAMDTIKNLMAKYSPDDTMPIEIGMITKQIENAQKRVEAHNFDIRKNVLQYDDVMNKMREIIYSQRRQVLMGEDISESIRKMIGEAVQYRINVYCAESLKKDAWDFGGLSVSCADEFCFKPACLVDDLSHEKLTEALTEEVLQEYSRKEAEFAEAGADMRELERIALLRSVDTHWMDHIDAMDQLRQGIGLQSIGQRDPIIAYRNEGFDMFDEMVAGIREKTVKMLFAASVKVKAERVQVAKPTATPGDMPSQPQRNSKKNVGRNDPCPCGSGKKYKNCCGNKA